jgi:hypothetical protein
MDVSEVLAAPILRRYDPADGRLNVSLSGCVIWCSKPASGTGDSWYENAALYQYVDKKFKTDHSNALDCRKGSCIAATNFLHNKQLFSASDHILKSLFSGNITLNMYVDEKTSMLQYKCPLPVVTDG